MNRIYFKIYRRRHRILLAFAITFVLIYHNYQNDNDIDVDNQFEASETRHRKSIVNINNYKAPPPCEGCPGEMGAPVNLTVKE